MSEISKVKINNTIYEIDTNLKTINGESLKGEGNLELGADVTATLLWEGSKTITDTSWTGYRLLETNTMMNYSILFLVFGQTLVDSAKLIIPLAITVTDINGASGNINMVAKGSGGGYSCVIVEAQMNYVELPAIRLRRAFGSGYTITLEKIYAI